MSLQELNRIALITALIAGVPPFLPADPGKIAFTAAAGARIRKSVSQAAILPSPRPGT